MSRIQFALNVDDLEEAVTFYAKLFNTQPVKLKEGDANFAIAEPPLKLVLFQNPGQGGTVNRLGVEIDSGATVQSEIARLTAEGVSPTRKSVPHAASSRRTRSGLPGLPARGGRSTQCWPILRHLVAVPSAPTNPTLRVIRAAAVWAQPMAMKSAV